MFPSVGCFKNMPCPFEINGLCGRMNCFFQHSKETTENNLESWTSEADLYALENKPNGHATNNYNAQVDEQSQSSALSCNETSKCNSIPISILKVIKEQVFPEYHPTPIWKLNNSNASDESCINSEQNCVNPVIEKKRKKKYVEEYVPQFVRCPSRKRVTFNLPDDHQESEKDKVESSDDSDIVNSPKFSDDDDSPSETDMDIKYEPEEERNFSSIIGNVKFNIKEHSIVDQILNDAAKNEEFIRSFKRPQKTTDISTLTEEKQSISIKSEYGKEAFANDISKIETTKETITAVKPIVKDTIVIKQDNEICSKIPENHTSEIEGEQKSASLNKYATDAENLISNAKITNSSISLKNNTIHNEVDKTPSVKISHSVVKKETVTENDIFEKSEQEDKKTLVIHTSTNNEKNLDKSQNYTSKEKPKHTEKKRLVTSKSSERKSIKKSDSKSSQHYSNNKKIISKEKVYSDKPEIKNHSSNLPVSKIVKHSNSKSSISENSSKISNSKSISKKSDSKCTSKINDDFKSHSHVFGLNETSSTIHNEQRIPKVKKIHKGEKRKSENADTNVKKLKSETYFNKIDATNLQDKKVSSSSVSVIKKTKAKEYKSENDKSSTSESSYRSKEKVKIKSSSPKLLSSHLKTNINSSNVTSPKISSHIIKCQTSPNIIKHQTSPNIIKHQTSPNIIKHRTSPNIIKHQTSPSNFRHQISSSEHSISNSDSDADISCEDVFDTDSEDTDEECRRIFNEDKNNAVLEKSKINKRKASGSASSEILNPNENMCKKFKILQKTYAKQRESNANSVNSISPALKRITAISNTSLVNAVMQKNRLAMSNGNTSCDPFPGTSISDIKTKCRITHVPSIVKTSRPVISNRCENKIASSVRQKYLNSFIDEYLKFCATEDEAYQLAVEKEKSAFDRCSSKTSYLNIVTNSLTRLRHRTEVSPTTSGIISTTSSDILQNTLSHQAIHPSSRVQNVSYSFEKKKHKRPEIDIKGCVLYSSLKKYLLTEEQLIEYSFPLPHPTESSRAVISGMFAPKNLNMPSNSSKRVCCRCQKVYHVNKKGDYIKQEECSFHWGKLYKRQIAGHLEIRYTCCSADAKSEGCSVGPGHVFEGADSHLLKGFVQTSPKSPPSDNYFGVYSLDCEMCYTTVGTELLRVTVVNPDLKPVYDSLVKPKHKILDYNTRFTGIGEEDLIGITTSVRDVQSILLCIFNNKTILIGHSLEKDLRTLKIIHKKIVDTSIVFPHKMGLPYKRSLEMLMAERCNKIIQIDDSHDSQEDAIACMELMLWKLKEDIECSE